MQDAYYHQDAAANRLSMENDWTNVPISPQPPFLLRRGGAGLSCQLAVEPQRTWHDVGWQGSDHYLHLNYHHYHADLATQNLSTADQPTTDSAGDASYRFRCAYPGCFAVFPGVLREHSKVHLNHVASHHAQTPTNPTGSRDHNLASLSDNHFGALHHTNFGALNDINFGNNGNFGPLNGINFRDDVSFGNDGNFGNEVNFGALSGIDLGASNDTNFTNHTRETSPPPFLGYGNNVYPTTGASGTEPHFPITPSGTSLPPRRFTCRHPGCTVSCTRPSDLRRHQLKHQAGPKFDCPNHGCPRKGFEAFPRKDKMLSHHKVCRAASTIV